jgi:hypothetical protein
MKNIRIRVCIGEKIYFPEIFTFDSTGVSFQTQDGYLRSSKFDLWTGFLDSRKEEIYTNDITDLGERVIFSNGSFRTTYENDTQSGAMLNEHRCKYITIVKHT